MDDWHIIRDPIHGFIKLSEVERELIDSAPFQRLRHIRQLALTSMVYPGAEHTRFSHSLGVMEMATKVFDTLTIKHSNLLQWKDDERARNRQFLRLMALLHDVGHAPFSHASEELLSKGLEHEDYTVKIIEHQEIKDIIDKLPKNGIDIQSQEVADYFSGKSIDPNVAFLKEIYAGEVDADKMDYLLRDSLYTGVHYGKFDYDRLINTLCLIPNPKHDDGTFIMAIEEGGIHALEALVLARYFMFTQVYFHRIRRSYDHHLTRFLKRNMGYYPTDVVEFLKWDDNTVFTLLKKHKDDEDAACILNRTHYVETFCTEEHPSEKDIVLFTWLTEEVSKTFDSTSFFADVADKAPHKFEKTELFVKKKGGAKPCLVTKVSKIIDKLQTIQQYRIFTRKSDRERVKKFCDDFMLQKKK